MRELGDYLEDLQPDPWRRQRVFSRDFLPANAAILDTTADEQATAILNTWLARSQPCLFGRLSARLNRLHYCILREEDIKKGDRWVAGKIQGARRGWAAATFKGQSSGFLVVLLSSRLAEAEPNPTAAHLAKHLCSLYLREEIELDQIYLDQAFLEVPGTPPRAWVWWAGVNYFAAHADGRWWQDHRIPGGIAFSVNSVGHLVKSGLLLAGLQTLHETLGLAEAEDSGKQAKVLSLGKALELAMLTIDGASDAVSGKATWLLDESESKGEAPSPRPACPIELPSRLAGKDYCEYSGYYHTDITLPSSYFSAAIERPHDVRSQVLDFTYLFHDSLDNPDFVTMGEGRPIRADAPVPGTRNLFSRFRKMLPQIRDVHSIEILAGTPETKL